MQDLTSDPDVFLRSMATRGNLGGLAPSTSGVVTALDAFGMDVVLVETVGAGQDEVEVAAMADTTVVVLTPGAGDDVQAMKAGIMEIADVLVVNKCDLPNADLFYRQMSAIYESYSAAQEWLADADPQDLRRRAGGHRSARRRARPAPRAHRVDRNSGKRTASSRRATRCSRSPASASSTTSSPTTQPTAASTRSSPASRGARRIRTRVRMNSLSRGFVAPHHMRWSNVQIL